MPFHQVLGIASISLWCPDMTFGRGHTEIDDVSTCVFMCATRYLVALKRDVTIVNLPLPSTTGPVLLIELVPVST